MTGWGGRLGGGKDPNLHRHVFIIITTMDFIESNNKHISNN